MKVVIISDLHANRAALEALPESYTELWVLGDPVNFGPDPVEVVEFVMEGVAVIVRGNHGHGAGMTRILVALLAIKEWRIFPANRLPRCSTMARAISPKSPPAEKTTRQNTHFHLCHAKPSDPLYGCSPPDSPEWDREVEVLQADVLLVGHTPVPLMRRHGEKLIVNPGSLGQPTSKPEACYAVWGDGSFQLKT